MAASSVAGGPHHVPMHDDGCFGKEVAARYDDAGPMYDPTLLETTTGFLADLAHDGPALEFAIGTGRSPCRSTRATCGLVASSFRAPWSTGCDPRRRGRDRGRHRRHGDGRGYGEQGRIGSCTSSTHHRPPATQDAQVAWLPGVAAHRRRAGASYHVGVPARLRRLPRGRSHVVLRRRRGPCRDRRVRRREPGLVDHFSKRDGLRGGADPRYRFRYDWPAGLDPMAQPPARLRLRERAGRKRGPSTSDEPDATARSGSARDERTPKADEILA